MASWRDKLRPASFRGVPFQVDGDKVPVGRRTVTHEYPGKNVPYVEDMGRVTREYKVTAFVIGPDYMDKRNALLKALEEEGEGELVHPWLGALKVKAGEGEMSHAYSEGGMCRFDLTFIESKEQEFPSGKANTGKQASAAGGLLAESGLSRFDQAVSAINSAQVTVAGIMKGAAAMYGVLQQYAAPIAAAIGSAQAFANFLVNAPGELTGTIRGILASVGGAFHVFDGFSSALTSLFGKSHAATETLAALPAPAGAEAAALQAAAVRLVQDLVLADAVTEIGEIPVVTAPAPPATVPTVDAQVIQPIERDEVPVADDMLELRDTVSDALWGQAMDAPQWHYEVITTARIQASQHLANVARQGVRLATVTPPQAVPALVLAYARYADATRAGEIVSRNRVAHPGFLPTVALQVAAK